MSDLDITRRSLVVGAACAGVAGAGLLAAAPAAAQEVPDGKTQWFPDYQRYDGDFIDYETYTVPGCNVRFRGPGFDPFEADKASYFTCLGSAHTYGRYFPLPYPRLLAGKTGLPALNLGVGGVGPGFYRQFPRLLDAINRGRFVVLQCMSARQQSNARFEAVGHVEFVRDRKSGRIVSSQEAWRQIVDQEPAQMLRYVAETRMNWIDETKRLLDLINVPVIFLWFSDRAPRFELDRALITRQSEMRKSGADQSYFIEGLSGSFPHFVDEWTAYAAADMCREQIICVTARGLRQPVINQKTGSLLVEKGASSKPGMEYDIRYDGINRYYPSPEMHEDAAMALLPAIGRVI